MRLKRGVPSSAWQRSRGPGTNMGELASASEFAPRGPPHPRVVLILLRDLRVLFLLPHHGDHLTATGPQLQSTARPPPLPEPLHPLPRELSPRRAQDQLRAGPAWRNDPEDQLRPSPPLRGKTGGLGEQLPFAPRPLTFMPSSCALQRGACRARFCHGVAGVRSLPSSLTASCLFLGILTIARNQTLPVMLWGSEDRGWQPRGGPCRALHN